MHRSAVVGVLALVGAGCSGAVPQAASPIEPAPAPRNLGYTATKYPIVLLHGLFGFKALLGTIEYFPGVAATLEEDGARVFVVSASQAAGSDKRVEELMPQIEHVLEVTGAQRLNLIGHSQGSIDARVIAAQRPELVASVTSVGGPHKGSPVADAFLGLPNGSGAVATQVLADLLKVLAGSDDPNDGRAALEFLQPKHAAAFNARFPAAVPKSACGGGDPVVDGIPYFSWGGVGTLTNPLDPVDPFIGTFSTALHEPGDGVVPRCSSHLGEVIRDDYLQNHPDEANLLLQLVSPIGTNPKALYRAHVNRLKNMGL
jgi:triacylglycerol lipase